jgi:hypothetical protein
MKPFQTLVILTLVSFACGASKVDPELLKEGDIVFQTSRSNQSRAIQLATHSEYSHMGLLFQKDDQWMVLEAIQPVSWTRLDRWVARGLKGHVVVKRVKHRDALLTPEVVKRMKAVGLQFLGRPYDLTFEWSDDRIYCSELVWKIYKEGAGLTIGELEHLRAFDLSHPVVQKKMWERYHGNPPMDEPVISPQRMFESPALETVLER